MHFHFHRTKHIQPANQTHITRKNTSPGKQNTLHHTKHLAPHKTHCLANKTHCLANKQHHYTRNTVSNKLRANILIRTHTCNIVPSKHTLFIISSRGASKVSCHRAPTQNTVPSNHTAFIISRLDIQSYRVIPHTQNSFPTIQTSFIHTKSQTVVSCHRAHTHYPSYMQRQ